MTKKDKLFKKAFANVEKEVSNSTKTLSRVTRIHETTDGRIKRLIESGFIPPEKVSKYFAGKGHPGDAEMFDWLIEQLEGMLEPDAELIREV